MARRRRRRTARPSGPAVVALLLALAVAGVAVGLIVRGDRTPRLPGAAPSHRTLVRTAPRERMPPTMQPAVARATPAGALPLPPAAASPTPESAGARLAIIIDDCGQWPDTERAFIALPAALTLSVLPHVRYGGQIARAADAAGKGVMMHLPMEPQSGIDPGPGRIETSMDDAAIAAQVRDDIDAVPLAQGVNNHEGSRATSDDRVMRDVAAVLAQRRLFFIDSRTSSTSVAERAAGDARVPTAGRDVFLDNVADVAATETQLRRAAAIARRHGSAIAIGHPRPSTLVAVREVLPELERDGITFVLARDLVR